MRCRHTQAAVILLSVCALGTSAVQARGGLAAFNEHTGQMVTAARYEPAGTVLQVTCPSTGRSVTVLVNDRGPFNGGRILDLSTGAFGKLFGGLGRGVGEIDYKVINAPHGSSMSYRGGLPNSGPTADLRWHRRHTRWHHFRHRWSHR